MNWFRLLSFLRRRKFEREMADEIHHHLELRQERHQARGLNEADARQAAMRDFGGVEQVKEAARTTRPLRWIERLGYEGGLVFRRLLRRRAQTALLLLTFGLSLGFSILSWSLFHSVFIQNPDFDPHGDLVVVGVRPPNVDFITEATREEIDDWESQQTVFTETAPVTLYNSAFLKTSDGTERMMSANLSTAALRMLGARPLLGRLFTPDEDKLGCAPVILLSEATWRSRFGADPAVIGRVLTLDGKAATVVGILPDSFRFPNSQQIWLPTGFVTSLNSNPNRLFDLLARLKPGISRARAQDELTVIENRRPPDGGIRFTPGIETFREHFLHSDLNVGTAILFALSLLFVLVSCSNAANLMLIDFLGRRVEIATSTALGIPRWALVRQLVFQVLAAALLAAAGAIVILVLVAPHVHAALRQMDAPYWLDFRLQAHHVLVALGLAVFVTAVAVVFPATFLFLVKEEELVRAGAGGSRGSVSGRWRRALLIGQVTLLTVLGIGAAALVRSNLNLANRSLGFDPAPVYLAKLGVRATDFPLPEDRQRAYRRIAEEAANLPGVEAAAVINAPPGYPLGANCYYAADPKELSAATGSAMGRTFFATEGFLPTLNIPLVAGENLVRTVQPDFRYAVINQSLASRLWPKGDALGRAIYVRSSPNPTDPVSTYVVRGVTRDFRPCGPMLTVTDAIYLPFEKSTGFFAFLMVRGRNAPPDFHAISELVKTVDNRVALYFPDTLQHQIDLTLSSVRITSKLTLLFAAAAALLCAVGIYSVTVSQIMQRSREFGIRMALGIEGRALWSRFTRSFLATAMVGVAIGTVIAVPALHLVKSLMYGVSPYDPYAFLTVASAIFVTTFVACIPCLFRLLRINPADCLRSL